MDATATVVALWIAFAVTHMAPTSPRLRARLVAALGERGFAVFAVLGCLHQDRRKLQTEGEDFRAWHAETSFFPFTGRDTQRGIRGLGATPLIVGIAVTIVLRLLHSKVFE